MLMGALPERVKSLGLQNGVGAGTEETNYRVGLKKKKSCERRVAYGTCIEKFCERSCDVNVALTLMQYF